MEYQSFDTVAALGRELVLAAVVEQVARLHWDATTLADHRRSALADTLGFATEHSPWYADRLAGVDLSTVTPDDVTALPVTTKADLMANWDRAVTDPRLTLDLARAHLAHMDADGPAFLLDEYTIFTTGGSTGEPGIFPWSLAELARWASSNFRIGVDLGDPPPQRMTFVGARSPRHASAWPPLLLYGLAAGRRRIVPIDQPPAAVIAALDEVDPDSVWMVSSMLPTLVAAKRAGHLTTSPGRIAIGGDCVDPAAVVEAEAVFGVRPTETYPTSDLGHLAVEAPGEGSMTVNDDLVILEAVDVDDRPVPAGELSHHVLVTSLHQRTLPMIRYRLDDRVRIDPTRGRYAAYTRIAEIEGRADDIFRYGSVDVHPHVFRSVLSAHAAVIDHQVRQTDRGANVTVVLDGDADTAVLRADLRAALVRAGVPAAEVEVDVSESIPRTQVGKRLRFLPAT